MGELRHRVVVPARYSLYTIQYIGWQASTTPYDGVNFIPPYRDYEFGKNVQTFF
jgi:hypothetical protein